MTNEEFQKRMLEEITSIKSEFTSIKSEFREEFKQIKTRQDDIYQVVRAIEHSNLVGKSELDSHNIRIAKVEGKLKKAAKVFNQDIEVDKASNL
jgi:hypothetical protein